MEILMRSLAESDHWANVFHLPNLAIGQSRFKKGASAFDTNKMPVSLIVIFDASSVLKFRSKSQKRFVLEYVDFILDRLDRPNVTDPLRLSFKYLNTEFIYALVYFYVDNYFLLGLTQSALKIYTTAVRSRLKAKIAPQNKNGIIGK